MTERRLTAADKRRIQIEVAALRAGHVHMRDVFAVIEGIVAEARREVVLAIERELDDADQITDSLQRPNHITVWGVRRALAPFGGKSHRWPVPAEFCSECGHHTYGHDETECMQPRCDCLLSNREAAFGRDEAMDDGITQAIWEDAVTNDEPWARDT